MEGIRGKKEGREERHRRISPRQSQKLYTNKSFEKATYPDRMRVKSHLKLWSTWWYGRHDSYPYSTAFCAALLSFLPAWGLFIDCEVGPLKKSTLHKLCSSLTVDDLCHTISKAFVPKWAVLFWEFFSTRSCCEVGKRVLSITFSTLRHNVHQI